MKFLVILLILCAFGFASSLGFCSLCSLIPESL